MNWSYNSVVEHLPSVCEIHTQSLVGGGEKREGIGRTQVGYMQRNQSLKKLGNDPLAVFLAAFSSVRSLPTSASQAETATSTTSPWAASFEMPNCMRLEPGPVK